MKLIKSLFIGISIVTIIAALFNINYHELTSRSNLGAYLIIVSMIFILLAVISLSRHKSKNNTLTKKS